MECLSINTHYVARLAFPLCSILVLFQKWDFVILCGLQIMTPHYRRLNKTFTDLRWHPMPSGIQRDGLLIIIIAVICCCCCTGAFTLSHLIGFILKLVDKTCQAYSMPLMEYSLDQHHHQLQGNRQTKVRQSKWIQYECGCVPCRDGKIYLVWNGWHLGRDMCLSLSPQGSPPTQTCLYLVPRLCPLLGWGQLLVTHHPCLVCGLSFSLLKQYRQCVSRHLLGTIYACALLSISQGPYHSAECSCIWFWLAAMSVLARSFVIYITHTHVEQT